MSEDNNLSKLLELEKHRFFKDVERITTRRQEELVRVKGELAAKGQTHSGFANLRIGNVYIEAVEHMVRRRIEIRKELISREPGLATLGRLSHVRDEIDQLLNGAAKNDSMKGRADDIERIRSQARRDLEILRLESETGILQPGTEGSMTVNISNSTVGALNLRGVIGDLSVSVQALQQAGNDKLASAVKELTETISKEESLGDKRRDLIESLSTISEQAVKPAEKRPLGSVKALMATIRDGVATVGSLRKLWDTFEPVIRGYFWPSS